METPNQDGNPTPVRRNIGESLPKKCPDCPSSELKEKMIKREVEKLARRNIRKCKKLAKLAIKAAKVARTIKMILQPSADPEAAPVQRTADEHYKKLKHFKTRLPPALEDWILSVQDVLLAE